MDIDALSNNGVDYVIIDNGQIAPQVKQLFPSDNGVNCVLELIGTVTLLDSIQAVTPKGIVCNTGILGKQRKWIIKTLNHFQQFLPQSNSQQYSKPSLLQHQKEDRGQ